MTIHLHLGVYELPYVDPTPPKRLPKAKPGKQSLRSRAQARAVSGQTTGDVATILEAKYHVIETFFDLHEEEIAEDFAEAMAGQLENLVMGAPPTPDPFAEATSAVQARFKTYLESEEIAGTATPGVPTQAALKGVNHRFKAKKSGRRPSFIDTGLYESSFAAWTEQS